jgi:hypothetical protein
MSNRTMNGQRDGEDTQCNPAFILRFQQPTSKGPAPTNSLGVQLGTRPVTEVAREAGDADPTTRTHFAIQKRG